MWYRIKSWLEAHIETHLVDDWRQVHRWYSARAAAAGVALITVWEALPGSMRDFLPHWLGAAVAYCTIAAVIAGRLTRQDIDQRTHSAPPKDGDGSAP